jgi:hypothetical protein
VFLCSVRSSLVDMRATTTWSIYLFLESWLISWPAHGIDADEIEFYHVLRPHGNRRS